MQEFGERLRRDVPRWLLIAGAGFLAAVALAALGETVSMLLTIAESPVRRIGSAGSTVLFVGALVLSGALVGAFFAARTRLTDRQLLLAGLGLVLLVRGGIVVLMDSPLANDGRAYQELAQSLVGGDCCFANRPTGYPILLAIGYSVFGEAAWIHEAINVAFALLGGWLLFDLVRRAFGRVAASLALAGFALMPGLALLTPVLLTDTVYATIVIGLCWAGVRMVEGEVRPALAAGALLAVSQYVRPVAPALLPAMVLIPLLFVRPVRRGATLVGLMLVTFLLWMLPVVGFNLVSHDELSVSTSAYGGWSLFMGTNQSTVGRYNDADAAIIAVLPGETLWERSEVAGRLGRERIASDPLGFAGLAVRKLTVMWGSEEFGVIFAFRPEGRARGALGGLDLVAQLAYVALVLAAAAGLVATLRGRKPPQPLLVVAVGLLLCEALVHTFLEVKPRYHAHSEVLLLLMAGAAVALLPAQWRPAAPDD